MPSILIDELTLKSRCGRDVNKSVLTLKSKKVKANIYHGGNGPGKGSFKLFLALEKWPD